LVKLRLQRYGRKKRPYYHLVAADARARRDGRIIEDLGRYNPVAQPAVAFMNTPRVIFWLQNGAQPTDTVRNILKKEGIFFRMHLIGWGKTEEEIEQTIDTWKADRSSTKVVEKTRAELRKAALKAEEGTVKKAEAAAVEARAKAEADAAKAAAEAPAVVEEVAVEAAAEEAPAAEDVVAEVAAEEVVAEVVAEEAPAADEVVDAEAAPADEAPAADAEEAK
jgi:small subunit ribosomal protein S16